MSHVTIKDVAEAAGVGIATASRALNGRKDVSAATRRRVIAVADRLGYVPNSLARGLLSGRTQTVGVIVSSILNPFYAAVVAGIESRLSAKGYNILLYNSDEEPGKELAAVKILMEQRVDGIILAPVEDRSETVERVANTRTPIVLVARKTRHPDVDLVVCDDFAIGKLATETLIQKGHRRILFVNSVANSSARLRREGYRHALERARIPYDERLVRPVSTTERVEDAVAEVLASGVRPTAVFSFCDVMTLGILRLFRERGIRVPGDMAVVSCDNLDFSALVDPPLTTIDIPKREMGIRAAEMLLEKMRAPGPVKQVVLAPSLIERSSA